MARHPVLVCSDSVDETLIGGHESWDPFHSCGRLPLGTFQTWWRFLRFHFVCWYSPR